MSFDYDKYANTGEFVKFADVGDQVVGVITELFEDRDFNGNPCPGITLVDDEGNTHTVTASQVMLRAELAEKRPQVGDKVRITYSGIGDAKPGKAPAKLFTIDVKPGPHEVKAAAPVADDAPF